MNNTVYLKQEYSKLLLKDKLYNLTIKNCGIQTGPFGSQLHKKDYVEHGTPIITVEHLGENRIIHENCPKVSEIDKVRLSKYTLEEGDIVFSRVGSVDRRSIVRKKEDGWLFSGRCLRVRPDPKKINPEYLSWFLGLPTIKDHIRNIAVGATMPSLNTKLLSEIEISYPPLPEQRAIADILSSLDDKIELNNRMNKTLEQMARAIFNRWFVEFEFPPLIGSGLNPTLSEGGYKSSSGVMIDSELGMIPEGWSNGCLGDIINNYDSKRIPLSKSEREKRKGLFPYYGAASLMDYIDNYIFDGIYLLMGEDGSVIDDNGFPMLQYVWGKFWVNNHTHVIQGKDYFSTEYIYILLQQTDITHIVTGAVQAKINQKNMNSIKVIIPNEVVVSQFNKIIYPIFEKIRNNDEESRTLSLLRDSLLPKLMSGELRVPPEKVQQYENVDAPDHAPPTGGKGRTGREVEGSEY